MLRSYDSGPSLIKNVMPFLQTGKRIARRLFSAAHNKIAFRVEYFQMLFNCIFNVNWIRGRMCLYCKFTSSSFVNVIAFFYFFYC